MRYIFLQRYTLSHNFVTFAGNITNKIFKTLTQRRNSKPQKSKGLLTVILDGVDNALNNANTRARNRKVFAVLLILFCIFSLIAFISYFFTGTSDESVVEVGTSAAIESQNWLGFMGAKTAELLVRKGFGVMSFLLPVYGIIWGLAMLEDEFYNLLGRMFKWVFFGLVWGASFLGFIAVLSCENETVTPNLNLGGGVGDYINQTMFAYVGKIGMGISLFFAVIIFLIIIGKAEEVFNLILNTAQTGANTVSKSAKVVQEKAKTTSVGTQTKLFASVRDKLDAAMGNNPKPEEKPETTSQDKRNKPILPPNIGKDEPELPTPPPDTLTEKPIEVNFRVRNKNLPPVPEPKIGENGQLELVIAEGDPEMPAVPRDVEIVSRERLGEDNVERIITANGDEIIERILNDEDEVIDNLDDIDWELYDPTRELSDYERPPLELLQDHGTGRGREVNRTELEENKNKILQALKDFGIEIQSIKATIGPTVTLYEIVPSAGVRISKIRNLEDDIALSLAALGIRIIAPMPGKGTIGIEIPNSNPETVSLRSVFSTEKYFNTKAELPIAIGRTISNEVFIADLNKLPHLLMAGSTGQGKSVGINTIIASILYKRHPCEVKFILIDPKKVELNLYQPLLHHFLAVMPDQTEPTITDSKDAVAVLKSLCIEMDNRYTLLKAAKVRNLKEYNDKFNSRRLNPRKGHKFLPYIVLIIDELADLMMVSGKEVEMPIARLAQLARAVGIHLVVATQRPSVNVITGIIKANFPARLSYRVISKVDSRTILDANGADQLIGRGDLLFYTGNDMIRIQNAFIETSEVDAIVEFIAKQKGYPDPYFLPEAPEDGGNDLDENGEDFGERDQMFDEAAKVVVRYQLGSASLIQRKLKLGYARAGRIIDQLERAGIVGPHSGSKARQVLVIDETFLDRFLKNQE